MSSHAYSTPEHTLEPESAAANPLLITVRFSASIPDLFLDIESPETTTAAGMKQLIRTHIPSDLSAHRLRLIYAGRGLEDATPLTISLRLLPPSPTRTPNPNLNDDGDSKEDADNRKREKGKAPIREQPRLYIHCSIGDIILSEADLAEEAAIASTLLKEQQNGTVEDEEEYDLKKKKKQEEQKKQQQQEQEQASTTTPAPRGFDRLLTAGFTAAEVTALRSQFMAVQSVSRTADTMPSGAELRDLEDRWLDEGTTAGGTTMGGVGAGGGVGGGGFADDEGEFGVIDDMLWGAVMGFFWPIGCAMWLRREEGVWSWRKGLAVFVGVVINAAFGAMRIMN